MIDTHARLAQCFAAVFPDLTPAEIEGARPDTVAGWDSTANVTLLAVIEEEFDLTVAADDLERLDSFAALLAYVSTPAGAAA